MMYPDKLVEKVLLNAVHKAAVAAWKWAGKGNGHAADDAATKAMRQEFAQAPFVVHVVIGEGERDNAPMLARGEKIIPLFVSSNQKSEQTRHTVTELDCAVDPCDGTSLLEKGLPGAITIALLAEAGGILGAPDFYMEKFIAPAQTKGKVFLEQSISQRINALSNCLGKPAEQLCIAVQDRPRHAQLIKKITECGAKVCLFKEGDVVIGIQAAMGNGPYDALMGIGAAPEGIITAAVVRCVDGFMEGRFVYDPAEVMSGLIGTCKETNARELLQAGIHNPDKHYTADELVPSSQRHVALCGITDAILVSGVKKGEHGDLVSEAMIFSHHTKTFQKDFCTH